MKKKNFTLDDIEKMLEELGFEWIERLIYNPNNDKYKELKINTFKKNKTPFLYLKVLINGNRALAMAEIDSEKFVLTINDCKLDASDAWIQKIAQHGVKNEC